MVATENLLDDPLFKASEFRADGYSWEAAAAKLKMTERELRTSVHEHKKRWNKLLREADRAVLGESGRQANRVLRLMLRDGDPKMQLKAAEIHHRAWSAMPVVLTRDEVIREDRGQFRDVLQQGFDRAGRKLGEGFVGRIRSQGDPPHP